MANQNDDPAPQSNNNAMFEDESFWFYAAVSSAICLIVSVIFGFSYAWIEESSSAAFSQRIDAVYKLSLLGGALVTFCTVAWRGLVSIRQANAQVAATRNQSVQIELARDQIQLSRAQVENGQINEIAKLLQKGAELIAASEAAHRSAGLATLQFIAKQNIHFSEEAINLVAEQIGVRVSEDRDAPEVDKLISALDVMIKEANKSVTTTVTFSSNSSDLYWVPIPNVKKYSIKGGVLGGWNSPFFNDATSIKGRDVKVYNARVRALHTSYRDCKFDTCSFIELSFFVIKYNKFRNCNFSGSLIDLRFIEEEMSEIRNSGNYFYADDPPKFTDKSPIDPITLEQMLESRSRTIV